MRRYALVFCGALAACTSGAARAPDQSVFYEVPQAGTASVPPRVAGGPAAGPGDDFTQRIESALGEPAAAPPPGGVAIPVPVPPGASASPLDDDRLNLNLYTLEQQRIDAAIAEQELQAARQQLVIVEPGAVPRGDTSVNIALFAQQTSHAVGERRYSRSATAFASRGNCRRFASQDEAQRVFLASGGPERDPYNLDPDGDGFACDWDPAPYRRLRL